jgi:hypothetical protein
MSERLMSRRKFLVGAGTIVGAASVSGLVLAERPAPAQAATTNLPWKYPTDPAFQPDPDKMGQQAYEIHMQGFGCAEACWWPVVRSLAQSTDSSADYAGTWGTLPCGMFKFGGAGINSWGTICGTLNASCALIALTGANSSLEDVLMQYYCDMPLPTNAAERDYAAGTWTLGVFDGCPTSPPPAIPPVPATNAPTSTAHSPLCHESVSQWMMAANQVYPANAYFGSAPQKDRCSKLCYDVARKTTQLLNTYWANNAKQALTWTPDSKYAGCTVCHASKATAAASDEKGKMPCGACHDQTTAHSAQ